jgi:two-component sensor histidine kinase
MRTADAPVLIFAPLGRDADVGVAILEEVGLQATICPDLDALARGLTWGGCALVTEEALLSSDRRALAQWVAQQPPWSDFPFILLTSRGGSPDFRLPEMLGNVTVLERPFHPAVLANAAKSALRARARQREVEAHHERQALLIAELNHRVKNTLATVQSLAHQTFKQPTSSQAARERFEARLMSLSRTHNLLNESSWTGASLREVLALELEPYIADRPQRLVSSGPPLELQAPAAVALGMILHELATNAAKYGALSRANGYLCVEWSVREEKENQSVLWLRWVERDGPIVMQPSHRGFGSRLIETTARHQLDGRVDLHFDPEGLVCELQMPFEAQRQAPAAMTSPS